MSDDFKGAVYHIKEADENFKGAIFHVKWVGGGGGGEVDKGTVVNKAAVMPAADASTSGQVYMYDGATDATYTHGYIYQNQKTATYTGTVSFEAATLSGTTVTCSGDDFATFLTEAGADPTPIVSGTMTYEADATGWRLVGKDSNNDTVTTFLEYVEDYEDAGFTFTGTPQDGDVVAFTCTVEEDVVTYAWVRLDVQPASDGLPDQTGNAGKVLKTDGSTASWEDIVTTPSVAPVLTTSGWSNKQQTITVSGVTATNTVIVSPAPASAEKYAKAGVLCTIQSLDTLVFSCETTPSVNLTVNVVIL